MRHLIPLFATLFLIISSCIDEGRPILPNVEGRPGDVTVVMEDDHWEKDLGKVVRDSMQVFVEGIASPEYKFDLDHVSKERFGEVHKRDRNLLIFRVKGNEEEGVVIRKGDLWAENQLYILVTAKSYDRLVRLAKAKIGIIKKKIDSREMQRLQNYFHEKHNAAVMRRIAKTHSIRVLIPEDFNKVKVNTDTFTYVMRQSLRRKKVKLKGGGEHQGEYIIEEGLLIYERPFTGEEDLSKDSLIAARDRFVNTHLRQPKQDGAYMRTTPDSLFNAWTRPVIFNNTRAVEMHGHWGISDDDGNFYGKGGPFVSLSVLDPGRKRIVTIEGFVHSPEFSLREYLRKAEAIIYSFELMAPRGSE